MPRSRKPQGTKKRSRRIQDDLRPWPSAHISDTAESRGPECLLRKNRTDRGELLPFGLFGDLRAKTECQQDILCASVYPGDTNPESVPYQCWLRALPRWANKRLLRGYAPSFCLALNVS